MVYCINPKCPQRHIVETAIDCPACHTPLLINNRYFLVKPLRSLENKNPYAEIFDIEDIKDDGKRKVLKVLINDFTQLVELFNQEATLLCEMIYSGIPKAEEKFDLLLISGQKLHCLVMERIEGENLEQWLDENGRISDKQAIDWLKQLVEILDYVHQKQLFHRDIKPSNIMLRSPPNSTTLSMSCKEHSTTIPTAIEGKTEGGKLILIDFGTARRVTETVIDGRNVTVVYSDGYTAPEQMEGRAVPQSDFFALGRTFVHLLTGKHPNTFPRSPDTGKLVWEDSTERISKPLVELINQLMERSWQKRPKDTRKILQCIKEIEKPNSTLLLLKWGRVGAAVLLGAFGIYGSYWYVAGVGGCSKIWLRRFPTSDLLSCGEENLVPGFALKEAQQGVNAFAAGKYGASVDLLEKAWKKRHDAETLIYLNNARLMGRKSYAIAVVAPITNNRDAALEILRGVALAQNEINRGNKINGWGLKVLIADDDNNPAQAKQIAEKLVSQGDILGVVGHFSSEATASAADVYRQNQLAMISPTSTSENVSIYRTVPSDRVSAQALASYLINISQQRKVAVFYNPLSNYSQSLRDQFRITFLASGGKIIEEFDLSDPLFAPSAAINQAIKQALCCLVLLPDSQTSRNAYRNALKVIKANKRRYLMVGADSLYTSEILQMAGKEAENNLVLAIPWHSKSSPNLEFPTVANKLWGGEVSWRTAMAYDATRVLITALEKQQQPNRISVLEALADPNFEAAGATGEIHFHGKGDRREPNIELVKVVPSKDSEDGQIFVPLTP